MAKKVVSIVIEIDGKQGKEEIREINDGLRDLDVRSAKQAFQTIEQFGGRLKNIGEGLKNFGQQMTIGVTLPILGLAGVITKIGSDYESALNGFQAVTKATTEEMAQAAEVAKELGADIQLPATSAKDAALAMEELGKAGFTAAESMSAAKGVLQLAAAGQLDEARAAEIAANALNSFSLAASESTRVADLLAAASNASSAGVTDIAEALAQSSASFAAAKVPIEDLTSAIAIMANAGIKGSDAGTSLKTFLSSIQAPSNTGAEALKKLGISVFDVEGRMRSLPDIIGQFEKSLAGLTDEQKVQAIQNIFGSDASRAAQILFKEGAAGFDKIKTAVTETGAAADLAASKTKGVGGALESLKSQAETIGITIFDVVKTPLEGLLRVSGDTLGKVGDYLSNLAKSNPELVQLGVVILGIAAAIGPLLAIIGTVVVAVGSIITAFGAIGTAVAAAGLTFSGIGAILLGVVAVFVAIGAAAYGLYQAYQSNFGNIQGVVTVFVGLVSAAFNDLLATIQPALDAVSNYAQTSFKAVSDYWIENGAILNAAATKTLAVFLSGIREGLEIIREIWAEHGERITAIVKAAFDIIKTIFSGAASFLGNAIKLIAQLINNDWIGAWATFKTIVSDAFTALYEIIKGAGNLLLQAVTLAYEVMFSGTAAIVVKASSIGSDIGRGIYDGLLKWIDPIGATGRYLGKLATDSIGIGAQVQSPSKLTIAIGEFVGEGLALGIENKVARVRNSAKKLAAETIKELKEAIKSFGKLAGASSQDVARIQATTRVSEASSAQQEIIKLRGELGVDTNARLPRTIAATESELQRLQELKKRQDEYNESVNKYNDLLVQQAVNYKNKLQDIKDSGAADVLNLQKEIALTGVTNELDRQRIENLYEVKILRETMAGDGYNQKQIDEAAKLLTIEQARKFELQQILNVRRQAAEAGNLEKSLLSDLTKAQNGNRELSEYEKTLAKISTDLKDLAPSEKERLLNIAKQIDGQKQFNEQYQKTYDFIRDTFDILTEKGVSFGDKLKNIFGGIADRFKKMLLDMASQWLTSKIFGGAGGGSGSGASSGGFLSGLVNIFGGLFGGSRSGGSGVGSVFGSGNQGNGVFSFGSGSNPFSGAPFSTASAGLGGRNPFAANFGFGGGSSGGSSGFSSIFGSQGFGNNVGTYGALGTFAALGGGLIGGRVGSFISGAGTGAALGAQIGSFIPIPGGTAIGAGIGALAGGLLSLFGGDPKRKKDKKENLPKLNQGFLEAFTQLQQILTDSDALKFNPPEEANTRAAEIYAQIKNGFGVEFLSKKYKKEAGVIIGQKTKEADAIIGQIKTSVLNAQSYGRDAAALVPVFASGAFISQYSDFKRRNGMLGGVWTGRDTLPSMLAEGEMVLNPMQQNRVRKSAGYDVFKGAGIPNYADGGFIGTSPNVETTNNQIVVQNNMTLYLQGEVFGDSATAWIESEDGKRTTVNIVRKGFAERVS